MRSLIVFTAILLAFSACEKDINDVTKPTLSNEEEVITAVELIFTTATDTLTFVFNDPDGDGGVNGIADTIHLNSATSYNCNLRFLNTSNPTNTVDITAEIKEEAVDHLVCFETTTSTAIVKKDVDENQLPIGLVTEWNTSSAQQGTITIRLKHQPGVKTGSCDIGETDVEVTYPIKVN